MWAPLLAVPASLFVKAIFVDVDRSGARVAHSAPLQCPERRCPDTDAQTPTNYSEEPDTEDPAAGVVETTGSAPPVGDGLVSGGRAGHP
jgi:hypothetical protein